MPLHLKLLDLGVAKQVVRDLPQQGQGLLANRGLGGIELYRFEDDDLILGGLHHWRLELHLNHDERALIRLDVQRACLDAKAGRRHQQRPRPRWQHEHVVTIGSERLIGPLGGATERHAGVGDPTPLASGHDAHRARQVLQRVAACLIPHFHWRGVVHRAPLKPAGWVRHEGESTERLTRNLVVKDEIPIVVGAAEHRIPPPNLDVRQRLVIVALDHDVHGRQGIRAPVRVGVAVYGLYHIRTGIGGAGHAVAIRIAIDGAQHA